jgi:DNA-directed RNA polymerase subunit H (RpoH/RPB5)
MSDTHWFYRVYLNVRKCLSHYRKHTGLSEELKFDAFMQAVQLDDFILITSYSEEEKLNVLTVLVADKRESILKIAKHLHRHIKSGSINEVILITQDIIRSKVKQKISNELKKKIYNYRRSIFLCEIPLGLDVPKHRILGSNEANYVIQNVLHAHPEYLSKIELNDPQVIWNGGKVGQIIEIEDVSSNAFIRITWALVIPKSKQAREDLDKDEEFADVAEDTREPADDVADVADAAEDASDNIDDDDDIADDSDSDSSEQKTEKTTKKK